MGLKVICGSVSVFLPEVISPNSFKVARKRTFIFPIRTGADSRRYQFEHVSMLSGQGDAIRTQTGVAATESPLHPLTRDRYCHALDLE